MKWLAAWVKRLRGRCRICGNSLPSGMDMCWRCDAGRPAEDGR